MFKEKLLSLAFLVIATFTDCPASTCQGTTKSGSLKDGIQIPKQGTNFESYSLVGHLLGRTYVHEKVHDAIVNTYAELNKKNKDVVYVFGETGWSEGGSFKPHKTHQNGTSVDFMVPVRDQQKKSTPIPCSLFNKFCYSIEFDKKGYYRDLKIDFDAMAEHLIALEKHSKKLGFKLNRVIFDPDLTVLLKKSKAWSAANPNIYFSPHKPWVRHDEHYHIDFDIRCSQK